MNESTPQGTPRSSASTQLYSPRDVGKFCESRTADEIDRALLNLANSSPPLPGKPSGQSKLVDASRANAKEAKAFTKKKGGMTRPAAAGEGDSPETPKAKGSKGRFATATPAKVASTVSTANCKDLKNLHSKNYHRKLAEGRKNGLDDETAKRDAREAANKAKNEYLAKL